MPLAIDAGPTPPPPERKGQPVASRDPWGNDTTLQAREKWNRQLIDALPAAVYTCDAAGRITWCNEAAIELWGRQPELGTDQWNGAYRAHRLDGTPFTPLELPTARALLSGSSIRGE